MSRRVTARASKKARGASSSAPPPPPSPPSSPPPPGDLPRPEWASRPLHKLTQFNLPFFQHDEDTTWAVEQLRLRQQLGICAVTAPTYPRLVRLFYQNLHETPTTVGLLSNIDGQVVHITSAMIATVLEFFAKPDYQPFPEVEDQQPIHHIEDMSHRVSARVSKKARGASSSAPPPPPSPPSLPPPPGDLPRPEWASRPLHKLLWAV
ncbi:uncharacterized protein LOC114320056 [Camellia sinensis]|uniref:uncharacterized protein LOC114320056 n=1 Tax=Camellia sinensis TaxID=4442 RepID=UPI001035F5BD|nr:uncharacterized protein LOC114320056 [Camellia sinensis]